MSAAQLAVVDDEPRLAEILAMLLRRDGHKVDVFATAEAFLSALAEQSFDLLLTDLMLPGVDGLELLERCYASGLGFHEGDIQIAVDNRADVTWYRNILFAPLYRRDLDLVAVAPDGSIAAFCAIWFDDVTRSAYFEPVATVPAHQRRGLAKALMSEGLQRLQRMGALTAFVSGYSVAANALYQAVMGNDHATSEPWVKEW